MKRVIVSGLIFFAGSAKAQTDDGFLASLKPDDLAAAGLTKLTELERAHLQELVDAYRDTSMASRREPPALVGPGQASATVLLAPGTKVEYTTTHSTIRGEFEGWKPRQVLTLANGQQWRVIDEDRYSIRRSMNPEVEITPSKFGGYWMRFPALKARVRVELLRNK